MIYDIEISDQAEIDLRGIFEYIAFELQAPENAGGQLDRLEACIMDLDHMPKRYRQYELQPWKSRGLRVAPVDNYLVLYIPDDDTQSSLLFSAYISFTRPMVSKSRSCGTHPDSVPLLIFHSRIFHVLR